MTLFFLLIFLFCLFLTSIIAGVVISVIIFYFKKNNKIREQEYRRLESKINTLEQYISAQTPSKKTSSDHSTDNTSNIPSFDISNSDIPSSNIFSPQNISNPTISAKAGFEKTELAKTEIVQTENIKSDNAMSENNQEKFVKTTTTQENTASISPEFPTVSSQFVAELTAVDQTAGQIDVQKPVSAKQTAAENSNLDKFSAVPFSEIPTDSSSSLTPNSFSSGQQWKPNVSENPDIASEFSPNAQASVQTPGFSAPASFFSAAFKPFGETNSPCSFEHSNEFSNQSSVSNRLNQPPKTNVSHSPASFNSSDPFKTPPFSSNQNATPEMQENGFSKLELKIGRRMFGWISVICFLLASVFFIQLAIQHGVFTLKMRLICTTILSVFFLLTGGFAYWKKKKRYSEILSGTGTVILFLTAYFADINQIFGTDLFHLPMILTVFSGLALSLIYRSLILAFVSMLGGLSIPILIEDSNIIGIPLLIFFLLLNFGAFFLVNTLKHGHTAALLAFLGTQIEIGAYIYPRLNDETLFPALVFELAFFVLWFSDTWLAVVWKNRSVHKTDFLQALLTPLFFFGFCYMFLDADYSELTVSSADWKAGTFSLFYDPNMYNGVYLENFDGVASIILSVFYFIATFILLQIENKKKLKNFNFSTESLLLSDTAGTLSSLALSAEVGTSLRKKQAYSIVLFPLFSVLSMLFLALAIPLQLEIGAITFSWMMISAALCFWGTIARHKVYFAGSIAFYLLGLIHLVTYEFLDQQYFETPLSELNPLINTAALSLLLICAIILLFSSASFWSIRRQLQNIEKTKQKITRQNSDISNNSNISDTLSSVSILQSRLEQQKTLKTIQLLDKTTRLIKEFQRLSCFLAFSGWFFLLILLSAEFYKTANFCLIDERVLFGMPIPEVWKLQAFSTAAVLLSLLTLIFGWLFKNRSIRILGLALGILTVIKIALADFVQFRILSDETAFFSRNLDDFYPFVNLYALMFWIPLLFLGLIFRFCSEGTKRLHPDSNPSSNSSPNSNSSLYLDSNSYPISGTASSPINSNIDSSFSSNLNSNLDSNINSHLHFNLNQNKPALESQKLKDIEYKTAFIWSLLIFLLLGIFSIDQIDRAIFLRNSVGLAETASFSEFQQQIVQSQDALSLYLTPLIQISELLWPLGLTLIGFFLIRAGSGLAFLPSVSTSVISLKTKKNSICPFQKTRWEQNIFRRFGIGLFLLAMIGSLSLIVYLPDFCSEQHRCLSCSDWKTFFAPSSLHQDGKTMLYKMLLCPNMFSFAYLLIICFWFKAISSVRRLSLKNKKLFEKLSEKNEKPTRLYPAIPPTEHKIFALMLLLGLFILWGRLSWECFTYFSGNNPQEFEILIGQNALLVFWSILILILGLLSNWKDSKILGWISVLGLGLLWIRILILNFQAENFQNILQMSSVRSHPLLEYWGLLVPGRMFWNVYSASTVFCLILTLITCGLIQQKIISQSPEELDQSSPPKPFSKPQVSILIFAGFVFWIIISNDVYHQNLGLEQKDYFKAQMSLTVFWSFFAGILMSLGFWKKSSLLRWTGILLLFLSIAKVLLYDLSYLDDIYRVIAIFALAVILMLVTTAYNLKRKQKHPSEKLNQEK